MLNVHPEIIRCVHQWCSPTNISCDAATDFVDQDSDQPGYLLLFKFISECYQALTRPTGKTLGLSWKTSGIDKLKLGYLDRDCLSGPTTMATTNYTVGVLD